jgi:hypothetical protein
MHISCAKRQMVRVVPLDVGDSGVVVLHQDEEPHHDAIDSQFVVPYKLCVDAAPGDVIAGLVWFRDVLVVLPQNQSPSGGLVFRDSSPLAVRVYFPHLRVGTNIEVVWENSSHPHQNPRYADSKGICSSPDPYRVCAVAGAMLCFG